MDLPLADHPDAARPQGRVLRLTAQAAAAIEAFFVRHRDHLRWLHIAMFVAFVVIMVVPLILPDPPATATPLTHFTTLANYVLWGLWFPLVFLSVIFAGRVWCGTLCPMGAASEWVNGFGLQRAIPGWLRWEGTPLVSFVVTTILGQTLGVRDHPEGAAEVFGATMVAALVIGFLYGRKKRVWCRHMCPIGRVLGLYSRLGAVQFMPAGAAAGRERALAGGAGQRSGERGICPTMIDLARKTESRHCITCFRCVMPEARGGMRMRLRRPGAEIEQIRDFRANPAEVWFLFLDTGVALGGFLWLVLPLFQDLRQRFAEWIIDHDLLGLTEPGPAWLMSVHPARAEVFSWLDFLMIVAFMSGCMVLLTVILTALTAVSAAVAGRVGADGGFRQRFTELGYQYAPVALVSLIIGLGTRLFMPIADTPLGMPGVHGVEGTVFVLGVLWSIVLGERILARQGVAAARRWLPLLPGVAGSAIVGLLWWPAIFGA
ncbi:MAG: 4Fe-4S binding protein [Azospirillaceae bacterium]|nr:4Fe-4S binding protein [Azospirillaceae bacterium]